LVRARRSRGASDRSRPVRRVGAGRGDRNGARLHSGIGGGSRPSVAPEPVSPPERPPALARIALAGILALAVAHTLPFRDYLTDDTFIHLQFAKNLLRG